MREDPDIVVRWKAAEALGALGDAAAVEPLIEALQDEKKYVRLSAVKALGALNDERAQAPLAAALDDDYVLVREAAEETILSIKLFLRFGKLDQVPSGQRRYTMAGGEPRDRRSWLNGRSSGYQKYGSYCASQAKMEGLYVAEACAITDMLRPSGRKERVCLRDCCSPRTSRLIRRNSWVASRNW